MNSGRKQQLQKAREPYGKVTEVGQVPVALQEIREMLGTIRMLLPSDPTQAGILAKDASGLTDSIITVTCANPGCLSQMAEGRSLKPIEQAFTCHGCDTEIIINQDGPKHRVFEWADGKTGKKHPYCFDCDGILIQGGELPNAKKKVEVQS